MNCGKKPDVALLEIIFPEISALFKGNYTPRRNGYRNEDLAFK